MALRESLQSYANQCATVLTANRLGKDHVNEDLHLREGVEALKQDGAFERLIGAAQERWGGDFHKLPGPTCNESEWPNAVSNVLNRSSFYHAVAQGIVDITGTERRMEEAFSRRKAQVTYLAPLEFVSLKATEFDFRSFAVKRFTQQALDEILEVPVCRAFYPHAAYETRMLRHYHFVRVCDQARSTQIGNAFHKLDFDLSNVGTIPMRFSRFPQPLETALSALTLFRWREDQWKNDGPEDDWEGAFCFHVPFVIKIDDDILDRPRAAHDLRNLAEDPDPERSKPHCLSYVQGEEEVHFKEIVGGVEQIIQRLGGWEHVPRYLANAMGFILKACFSDRRDGMLWNTVAIEALLGRNEQSLTRNIGRRLEWIGAISEAEFKKLYDQRCRLVHGSLDAAKELKAGGNAPLERNTKEVRDAARQTVMWFLNLEAAKSRVPSAVRPTHDELLDLLDFRPSTRGVFSEFLTAMPREFPKIEPWIHGIWLQGL